MGLTMHSVLVWLSYKMGVCIQWTDWTGLDWTGLDWNDL